MVAPSTSHTPLDFASRYLGPVGEDKPRVSDYYSYSDNQAPAHIPTALLDLSVPKALSKKVEELVQYLNIDLGLLEILKKDISNHFELRIQIFFQQLLLVYKTHLQFQFYNKADHQIGQATGSNRKYAAAHYSTLPCLRLDTEIAFLMHSFFYKTWNGTTVVPEVVNGRDSDLDWRGYSNDEITFRWSSIAVLNGTSIGQIDPKEGLVLFLESALERLYCLLGRCKNIQKKMVLELYIQTASYYQQKLAEDDGILKLLCFDLSPSPLNDDYYLKIQNRMHHIAIREMAVIHYSLEISSRLPAIQEKRDWTQWLLLRAAWLPNQGYTKLILDEFLQKNILHHKNVQYIELTSTAEKYKTICLESEHIREAVKNYFAHLTDENALKSDLDALLKSRPLTAEMHAIYELALTTIRANSTLKTKPRNMDHILISILHEGSHIPSNDPLHSIFLTTEQWFYTFQNIHFKNIKKHFSELKSYWPSAANDLADILS